MATHPFRLLTPF